MKNIIYVILALIALSAWSCNEEDFSEAYPDPSKIANTTIERQYTGVLKVGSGFVVPGYTNYFELLRITLNPWTQSIGWTNSPNQYIPGSAGVNKVWNNYYGILAQYREFQKVWNKATPEARENREIFNLTAAVYLYNETERMVDLFGAIPFSDAGMLSINGGDYNSSYAEYDGAEQIYTVMLDELKSIADQLNSINVSEGFLASFATQDIINNGDIDLWRRYANSLRLRMLTRVSAAPDFSSRASSEIAEILSNPNQYPVVEENDQNIMIDVYDINTGINSKGFAGGINSDGWDGNDASQVMIDLLKSSSDPRLRVMFEPGTEANGVYVGLDPLMKGNDQTSLVNNGQIAYYNRSTFSNNKFFPGVLINAANVSFLKAENYLKSGDDGAAKMAYEAGIRQSIEFYYYVRSVTDDEVAGTSADPTTEEINNLLSSDRVSWEKASSQEDKMKLIGTQKWLHFNIIQPYQNWAEVRRLGVPDLTFQIDNSSKQTLPPFRFPIPGNEVTYNTENYDAVRANDKIDRKIFWDVD